MRQFDLVENLNARTRSRYPFTVVLQHDIVSGMPTVVVAPLTSASSVTELDRLHPAVTVNGQTYRVIVEELAAVHRSTVGHVIGSLEAERFAIIGALDRLFTGF